MWKYEKDTEEGSRMGYSQLTFCCPYYESNGKRSVHCEGGRSGVPPPRHSEPAPAPAWESASLARKLRIAASLRSSQ